MIDVSIIITYKPDGWVASIIKGEGITSNRPLLVARTLPPSSVINLIVITYMVEA